MRSFLNLVGVAKSKHKALDLNEIIIDQEPQFNKIMHVPRALSCFLDSESAINLNRVNSNTRKVFKPSYKATLDSKINSTRQVLKKLLENKAMLEGQALVITEIEPTNAAKLDGCIREWKKHLKKNKTRQKEIIFAAGLIVFCVMGAITGNENMKFNFKIAGISFSPFLFVCLLIWLLEYMRDKPLKKKIKAASPLLKNLLANNERYNFFLNKEKELMHKKEVITTCQKNQTLKNKNFKNELDYILSLRKIP